MSEERKSPVINIADVTAVDTTHGAKFGGLRKRLAASTGAKEIGCSWFELPPGRQGFPHHSHYGNEEAFYILAGQGELRLGTTRRPVKAGDYIACPAGPESAHSLTNTGGEPLQYLAISTAHAVDIVVYPDSGKFSAAGGADMHKGLKAAQFARILKDQSSVDYYLDEE